MHMTTTSLVTLRVEYVSISGFFYVPTIGHRHDVTKNN